MKALLLFFSFFFLSTTSGQGLYFPPNGIATTWDTISPVSLGWCVDSIQPLYNHLDNKNTKAFIVLKDGKIALEKYFGTFTNDSLWYWASAGKTMTAFLTGLAQEDGLLDINDPTSDYLGVGWTNLTASQEQQITVLNQLSMTSGLDDGSNADCTDPNCLTYLSAPNTRWAYHNAPYTLLGSVIENATGGPLNTYLFQKLSGTTGLFASYITLGYNRVVFSTARSFARFGLLNLANGNWNGTSVLSDQNYLQAMHTPSQSINNSYGYLWWLNGQQDYMLPSLQFTFSGSIVPQAPPDMYCGIGKNDQLLCVVPSENIVVVRMGNAASSTLVPIQLIQEIWDYLNAIRCNTTSVKENSATEALNIWPNPSTGAINIVAPSNMGTNVSYTILDAQSHLIAQWNSTETSNIYSTVELSSGIYFIQLTDGMQSAHGRFVVD